MLASVEPTAVLAAAGIVQMQPDPNSLPGGQQLQNLINGMGMWALMIALAGLLIGAAAWAIGSHSQNYQQSMTGRRAVIACAFAALIVGAAPAIVNFFFTTGDGVHL